MQQAKSFVFFTSINWTCDNDDKEIEKQHTYRYVVHTKTHSNRVFFNFM